MSLNQSQYFIIQFQEFWLKYLTPLLRNFFVKAEQRKWIIYFTITKKLREMQTYRQINSERKSFLLHHISCIDWYVSLCTYMSQHRHRLFFKSDPRKFPKTITTDIMSTRSSYRKHCTLSAKILSCLKY